MKVAIQAVPERAQYVANILKVIPHAKVYEDVQHHGPFWGMMQILNDSPDGVLILQDDVFVADWFLEEAQKSIIPDREMSFCVNAYPKLLNYYQQGYSYLKTQTLVWGQANYHPAWIVQKFLEWQSRQTATVESENRDKPKFRRFYRGRQASDRTLSVFLHDENLWSYVTLPNLVNHHRYVSTLRHSYNTENGCAAASYLFGKKFLRPWNKESIVTVP
jgi:hypothetical protein